MATINHSGTRNVSTAQNYLGTFGRGEVEGTFGRGEEEGTHHHMVYSREGTLVRKQNQTLRPMPHRETIHHQQWQTKTA